MENNMENDGMSVEDLNQEIVFQHILLASVDETVADPEEAQELRKQVKVEIARLKKLSDEKKAATALSSTPQSSRFADPFAVSPRNSSGNGG